MSTLTKKGLRSAVKLCIIVVLFSFMLPAYPIEKIADGAVLPTLVVDVGNPGEIRAFSPDGRYMLTGFTGVVQLRETATGILIRQFVSGNTVSAAFSPDGHYVLTGDFNNSTARLWETATGTEIRQFIGQEGIDLVTYSPDGLSVLTSSCWDQTVRLWEAGTGREIRRFTTDNGPNGILSAVFSPDGRSLLTGDHGNTAKLWEVATGKEIQHYTGIGNHQNRDSFDTTAVFSPDGQYVLTKHTGNTARLWETTTGKEIRQFISANFICSAVFSPDGNYVLIGNEDGTANLLEVTTSREIRKFIACYTNGEGAMFSPDGRCVITIAYGEGATVAQWWDSTTGMEIRRLTEQVCSFSSGPASSVDRGMDGFKRSSSSETVSSDGRYLLTMGKGTQIWDMTSGKSFSTGTDKDLSTYLAISPDGRYVLTSNTDKTVHISEMSTGKEIRSINHSFGETAIFSPDSRYVLTIDRRDLINRWERNAILLDISTGRDIRQFNDILTVAFSPDGRYVLTESFRSTTANLWETTTGKEIRSFTTAVKNISALDFSHLFSPDGRYLLVGSDDNTARLYEMTTGKKILQLKSVTEAAFSPDCRYVLIRSNDDIVQLYEIATGKKILHLNSVLMETFSPDSRYILAEINGLAWLYEIATGREIHQFTNKSYPSLTSLTFSPDGRYILMGEYYSTASLWETATGKETHRFKGVRSLSKFQFLPDSQTVILRGLDGTILLYDILSGKELCRLTNFIDGTWAVIDPEGRYDASNGGDIAGLHWVINNEPIALNQLKDRYYEPGLLAKLMGYNKEPLRDVKAFTVALYPDVQVENPTPDQSKLSVKLTNRGGGIGKVRVLVNGKELLADARGAQPDPDAPTINLTVDLANATGLRPGEDNKIEVIAYNAEGYLASRGTLASWRPVGMKDERPPELYAIVAGVSDYTGEKIDLRYSAKDAADMANALQLGAKRMFGTEKVHVTLLNNSASTDAQLPTKRNMTAAFAAARKARPQDILVVYLAGHGVTLPQGQDTYCYLTQEASGTDMTDPGIRAQAAVTSDEMLEWLKQIPALKQVVILDTCVAGAAADKLMDKRAIPGDQIRALERLKDRTGFIVLMGCASNAQSYEATQYGQGLLTYSLLQGMKGAALRDDGFVDVQKLFQYAADQVPQLAQHLGGIQSPLIISPRGTSFDVGQLTTEDRQRIQLAQVKPMILRPNLSNQAELGDPLNLTLKLVTRLRDESWRKSAFVYVEADELPGAIKPFGDYTVNGTSLTINLAFWQDGKKVKICKVVGTTNDIPAILNKICVELIER